MTSHTFGSRKVCPHSSPPRIQRGVVLFIALIVMVALSLAGIALIRSTDTAGIVAGNLAFKQAASAAADRGLEKAIAALFDIPLAISDKNVDVPAQNYYACVRNAAGTGCIAANAAIPEKPDAVTSVTKLTAAGLSTTLVPADTAGKNNVYYVIERMCLLTGDPTLPPNYCNVATGGAAGLGSTPGTEHKWGLSVPGAPNPFYRLTIRVEGPRNTVTYAQAMLQ